MKSSYVGYAVEERTRHMLGNEGIGQSASPARLRFLGTAREGNPEAKDRAQGIRTAPMADAIKLEISLPCLF
jgi:hypothetical protein